MGTHLGKTVSTGCVEHSPMCAIVNSGWPIVPLMHINEILTLAYSISYPSCSGLIRRTKSPELYQMHFTDFTEEWVSKLVFFFCTSIPALTECIECEFFYAGDLILNNSALKKRQIVLPDKLTSMVAEDNTFLTQNAEIEQVMSKYLNQEYYLHVGLQS